MSLGTIATWCDGSRLAWTAFPPLLAQTMLKDPIEKMFTYDYLVTGNWSDPVVTRVSSATANLAPPTWALLGLSIVVAGYTTSASGNRINSAEPGQLVVFGQS